MQGPRCGAASPVLFNSEVEASQGAVLPMSSNLGLLCLSHPEDEGYGQAPS